MSLITNTIKIRTCRICLDANRNDMVLIAEQNGWLALFENCFGFTLTTQDEPRLLCKICADKVQNYVKFKEKCHKSHSLWKSVISDVKCYIVKHKNGENTNEIAKEPISSKLQIKDEIFDPLFDTDIHYSDDDDSEMVNLSLTELKTETQDEYDTKTETRDEYDTKTETRDEYDTKSRDDKSSNKKKKDSIRNKVDSTKINCKKSNSKDSVKSKEKQIYTCAKCKITYENNVFYLKHIKVCRTKIPKRRTFNQDYAYDLGRQYNGQNIEEVNTESQSQIKILGDETQDVSSTSCGLCNLSFNSTKDVWIHLNDHWSNNDLSCKLCDFVGIDLAAIASHRYSHFPRKDMRFYCHICEKKKHSMLSLHFHYRKEHLNKPGGYCSRCHKQYKKLYLWKKHEFTHCPPKHICDICGKGFHFKNCIKEHIINHMQLNKIICDICGKSFCRKRYLKTHKETVHTTSGPLKCDHCDRTFKSAFTLNVHQRNIVTREKTLKCEVCHKGFITPNTLKLHMVMHSNERPYVCNMCPCSYKYKSQLTHHLLKHYGFMPKCSICMRTFASAMSLKRHSAVHTGVRQYSCSVKNCDRTFHSKKQMLTHIELRHKNENGGDKCENGKG